MSLKDAGILAEAALETRSWAPVPLPYHRTTGLPGRIPSTAEIRTAPAIVKQRTGQTIVEVTPDIIVKYGKSTPEREGQTLLFLETCLPSIPAPRLYSMYHDEDDLYIVMQRVPGVSLDTIWDDLCLEEKTGIRDKLRSILEEMRNAPCPVPTFFGSVDHGPVPHHLFYSAEVDKLITGPFDNEEAFIHGLTLQYRKIQTMNNRSSHKTAFYERHFPKVLQNHNPTFTHSDIQRKNIVVNARPRVNQETSRSFDVHLVDWEDAGWYPEYWEYFSVFVGLQWDEDWCTMVEDIIPVWPAETALMKMLYQDLFF